MKPGIGKYLLCLLLTVPVVLANAAERPRVGLVLSGGGARGAAHISVLKVIEEQGVPIDYIAGTSMGAIIGGLYASGLSPEEIEKRLAAMDWGDMLTDSPKREDLSYRRKREDEEVLVRYAAGFRDGKVQLPQGLLQGQKLLLFLRELTLPVADVEDFDQLPIPFRAVATDISTGQAVVLDHGDLALAMRASSSIPSVFSPVELDGRLLVDGGVSNNLPVDIVRAMGADRLIVVDVSTPLAKREELGSVISITDQLTTIMTRRNTERSIKALSKEDVLVVPDLSSVTTTDFANSMKALKPGMVAARKQQARLARIAQETAGASGSPGPEAVVQKPLPVISFMELNNDSGLSDKAIERYFATVKLGQPLDVQALEAAISELYGLDLFKQISYRLVSRDGETGVEISVRKKPWGPNYLQAGLQFHGDWNDENGFNLGMSYTRAAVNPLGGEFRAILELGDRPRLQGEFYQPLDTNRAFFVHPQLEYTRNTIGYYTEGDKLGEYDLSETQLSLDFGLNLSSWGELRLGWRGGRADVEIRSGFPGVVEGVSDTGELHLDFGVDTLDSLYFPTSGHWMRAELSSHDRRWGDDNDFHQLYLDAGMAMTRDRDTLFFRGQAGFTLDSNAPLYGLFRLGGFLDLSGFHVNELTGQHMGHGLLGYMRRLDDGGLAPLYLGATLEAGNTWQAAGDIGNDWLLGGSMFLGLDTLLGPLYMGYALGEDDHGSLFMYFGAPIK
ncbi:patatin-like phospholipase family protein [Thiolapillus brandeum]|uniref:Patatin-like phospholipase family protein n=1 Tax=Thiolapillus brandeum TaxID=1076588 RepID=A0A7U6GH64_9GAMM|nr:patatin-like phospholipase family protein [Thiolapillus brandeum]BAO43547.1 patatin-like phospholipase family protein [Thiolapillus brandeum]